LAKQKPNVDSLGVQLLFVYFIFVFVEIRNKTTTELQPVL